MIDAFCSLRPNHPARFCQKLTKRLNSLSYRLMNARRLMISFLDFDDLCDAFRSETSSPEM